MTARSMVARERLRRNLIATFDQPGLILVYYGVNHTTEAQSRMGLAEAPGASQHVGLSTWAEQ